MIRCVRADDMSAAAEILDEARIGFHWPLCSVGHLHLHLMYPVSSMGLVSKLIFSKLFFGDVETAIQHLEKEAEM